MTVKIKRFTWKKLHTSSRTCCDVNLGSRKNNRDCYKKKNKLQVGYIRKFDTAVEIKICSRWIWPGDDEFISWSRYSNFNYCLLIQTYQTWEFATKNISFIVSLINFLSLNNVIQIIATRIHIISIETLLFSHNV